MELYPRTRREWLRLGLRLGALSVLLVGVGACAVAMPGRSFQGPLPPLDAPGQQLASELRAVVTKLATDIGPRDVTRPEKLDAAASYLEAEFRAAGYDPTAQAYTAGGHEVRNLEATLAGSRHPDEIVIVGAHYDSVNTSEGCPGADDNASGVAALLTIARRVKLVSTARTVRFVAFTNEEPPFFWTDDMGSVRYARRSRERDERVVAMLSLETLGFYRDAPGSQHYPFPFSLAYPDRGDFVGFVGNLSSRSLVRRIVKNFRTNTAFPSEGAAPPGFMGGVGLSDHWSFWQQGYPAVMVTDTAFFRNPWYHTAQDTPDKLDFERLARVVQGLVAVVADLASGEAL